MDEAGLIKYWAHMLDESVQDSEDVKIVPDDDYDYEAEYNSSLPPEQQKTLVRQSEIGLDLANGVYRLEQIVNPELLNEEKHSMHGPAWAARTGGVDEIADMRSKLANGIVQFVFWKHGEDGVDVERHAVGTTSELVVPVEERRRLDPNYDANVASYERRSGFIIWFWDLEKNAVRCFNTNRFDRIENYTPTTQRIGQNVQRVGNIFIHRDVDPGMEGNAPLDDAQLDEINGDIEGYMAAGGDWLGNYFGGISMGSDVETFEIERGPAGEPVLRIEIRKRGNDNDPPYQLRINELRQVINQRWGVNVKKVVIDGEIDFN